MELVPFKYEIYHEISANGEAVLSSSEPWLSEEACSLLVSIMRGEHSSERHQLFKKRNERQGACGFYVSRLHLLSNASFFQEDWRLEKTLIDQLMKEIFESKFDQADQYLQDLGRDVSFSYCTLVLLPELVIHKFQLLGLNREQAESEFLRVIVPKEEMDLLDREAERLRDQESDQEEDEWEDHSESELAQSTI